MSHRVVVNPIACTAHGMCAELLPERVRLDDWGYPLIDATPVEREVLDHARRAAQACPTFALLLQRDDTHRHDAHSARRQRWSKTSPDSPSTGEDG